MKREEFMKYAEREIDNAFRGQRNRMMNLVEQAWAEGKRNAEIDGVSSIVKGVLEKMNDEKQEQTSNLYHQYCVKCGWDWWSAEAFPDKCPNCKCDRT